MLTTWPASRFVAAAQRLRRANAIVPGISRIGVRIISTPARPGCLRASCLGYRYVVNYLLICYCITVVLLLFKARFMPATRFLQRRCSRSSSALISPCVLRHRARFGPFFPPRFHRVLSSLVLPSRVPSIGRAREGAGIVCRKGPACSVYGVPRLRGIPPGDRRGPLHQFLPTLEEGAVRRQAAAQEPRS